MLIRAGFGGRAAGKQGFTLAELVITTGVAALVIHGVVLAYVMSAQRAEWSAYSLAAHSLAMQSVEQARAAKWYPQAWPASDELGVTNFIRTDTLDVPVVGEPRFATNYVSVTIAMTNPPLRQIRADCVWSFGSRGLFTNSIVTLRAPDQ